MKRNVSTNRQIDRQTERQQIIFHFFLSDVRYVYSLAGSFAVVETEREGEQTCTDCDTDAVVQGCQFWAISVATHISFGQLSKQWQRDAPSLLPPVSDAIASRDLSRNATESISKIGDDALAGSLHSMAHGMV